jgi:hypothetical protein
MRRKRCLRSGDAESVRVYIKGPAKFAGDAGVASASRREHAGEQKIIGPAVTTHAGISVKRSVRGSDHDPT